MNKKGMTLIELIAVIAILAILSLITVPTFNGIKDKLLKNSLDSKLKNAETAALEYAEKYINSVPPNVSDLSNCLENSSDYKDIKYKDTCKSDCYIVTILKLVEEQYLVGDTDDKTNYTNPVKKITNEITGKTEQATLNNVEICVRYDTTNLQTRKLVAYVLNKELLY